MFFYFYDSFILQKKYEGQLIQVENRIIELGINGRVEKLSPLRNMKELIEDGIKQEAHTVVVVGNDATVVKALNIVANYPSVTLGYIPFDDQSVLAQIFGITRTEACNILSRRIVQSLTLGKANQNYFLTALTIDDIAGVTIHCDDHYTISAVQPNTKLVLGNFGDILNQADFTPQLIKNHHHQLQLKLQTMQQRGRLFKRGVPTIPTRLTVQKVTLHHTETSAQVLLDQVVTLKTPVTVTVKPRHLKMIVGKNRLV